jgi:hypothetical protein
MSFFHNLNKTLDGIAARPEAAPLNERDMSRAAKGYEKYGKEGMEALAKAGREGKDLDKVRDKYNKYDNNKTVDEGFGDTMATAGAKLKGLKANITKNPADRQSAIDAHKGIMNKEVKKHRDEYGRDPMYPERKQRYANAQQSAAMHKIDLDGGMEEGIGDVVKKVGGMAKKAGSAVLNKVGHGSDVDMIRDLQKKMNMPQTGMKPGAEPNPKQVKEKLSPAKQKSFAKLAPPIDKITFADKIAGAKKEVDEMLGDVAATAMKNAVAPRRNQDAMAGKQNLKPAPAGKETPLKNVAKGIKAFVQGKPEPMDEEKTKEPRSKGTAFDPDYQTQAKKEKEGTGNFDKKKISTGTVYTRKHKDDEEDEVKSDQPKAKGRPKGPAKGPERVTAKSYKYKGGRPVKENDISIVDQGEYDQEGDMAKEQLYTIKLAARELASILSDNENLPEWVQSKITKAMDYIDTARDYMIATKADRETMAERSVSQTQARMMAGAAHNPKFAKKVGVATKVAKEFNKADTGKDISRLPKKVKQTEEGAKPDFLDIDGDGDKKEPMKKAVVDKKEKKVAETTTSGSVATAPETKKSSGSMQFGKGVYEGAIAESYQKKLNTVLAEAMNVTVTMNNQTDGGPNKTINVSADGEDAEKLAEILKLAGLGGLGGQSGGCSSCGQAPCGCQTMDEAYGDTTATMNSPDYPTDTETIDGDDPYLRRFSGGLNGAKSTGQTTIPVIAGQMRRTSTMEENVELERSLFNTWKTYKG